MRRILRYAQNDSLSGRRYGLRFARMTLARVARRMFGGLARRAASLSNWRAMTRRWISDVPSPMVVRRTSRYMRSTWLSTA